MNLVKINKSISDYVDGVKHFAPDVYNIYQSVGLGVMGRKVYLSIEADENITYFNKSVIHKEKNSYVGKNTKGYYAQDLVDFKNEERCLCVNGNCDKYQDFGDMLMQKLGFKDFVFDVGFINGKMFLVEINEIHLSTINSEQLKFILSNIL